MLLVTNHVGETFLVVLHKDHMNNYRNEPIVSFYESGGKFYDGKVGRMSYYLSTFEEIDDSYGLCLDGYDCVKYSLTPENVKEVKVFIHNKMK